MEKHLLADFVHGAPEFRAEPWYNPHGDCIVYQMADEAVVAERIDEILTIYRSAIDNRPIGYQIKGVMALIQEFGWDGLAWQTEEDQGRVLKVTLAALLLAAYEAGPRTLHRRRGYAMAMNPDSAAFGRDELLPA